jgi:hypothetical protein
VNPEVILAAVNGVLSMVGTVLPMIPATSSPMIGALIKMVQSVLPIAVTVLPQAYQGIKNIISQIGSHPATTEEQMAALAQLDKTADLLWDSISAKFDPDYLPPGAA